MTTNTATPIVVQPLVGWPRRAVQGRTYLLTVDLQLAAGEVWRYPAEEYEVGCRFTAGRECSVEVLSQPGVVLHRFGSTYGPAQFLLKAREATEDAGLVLTLVNGWGIPIDRIPLEMAVAPAESAEADSPRTVPTELPQGGRVEVVVPRDRVSAVALGDMQDRWVVVSGDADGRIRVWDLADGQLRLQSEAAHAGRVLAVALGELDGPIAISSGEDSTVRVWDLATGAQRGEPLRGHQGSVRAVAFGMLDGRAIALSGGEDETLRVWDLDTGTQHGPPLTGHGDVVWAVAVGMLSSEPIALSCSDDWTVRVWDLSTGVQRRQPLAGHKGPIWAVAFGQLDGLPIAVGAADDGSLLVWELFTDVQHGRPLIGHTGPVLAVTLGDLDGRTIAVSGGRDATVRQWDLASGTERGSPMTGHSGQVWAIAVGQIDGRPIAATSAEDGSVRVWDLATGSQRGEPIVPPTTQEPDRDLLTIARHHFRLMMQNVASKDRVFEDPAAPGSYSKPGCIIASPHYPADRATRSYVFNWVRDAAITATEIAAADLRRSETLADYVQFANACQDSTLPTIGHACFTIEAAPRPQWSEQSDGPALQTLALLAAYPQLDAPTQAVAQTLITTNLAYLLGVYQGQTVNLWEEVTGASFFARAVQLRCFQQVAANTLGILVPSGTDTAIAWLQSALGTHWDGTRYVSVLPAHAGYDPNIDIVAAAVYGAIEPPDTKLLATAAALRSQWADTASPWFYPINGADAGRSIGPMLGRYPGDTYVGDTQEPRVGAHPFAPCTCNFAELYYRLGHTIVQRGTLPLDELSAPFFSQIGVDAMTTPADAQSACNSAGDKMLQAVIFHGDHLELGEQFDATTGYEKGVRNVTWSYAAFLSAVRARAQGS